MHHGLQHRTNKEQFMNKIKVVGRKFEGSQHKKNRQVIDWSQ